MMVAVILSGLIAYLALPQYSELNASLERMNTRKIVLQDLRRAQAETVTHGCRGIFTVAADKKSYSFGCDFLPYDVSSPPAADTVFFSRAMPLYFSITSDSLIIFNSKGQIVDELGFIDSRTVSLSDISSGSVVTFANGTVWGTGVFEYDAAS